MMQRVVIFLCVVFTAPAAYEATAASKGTVELDELTFDKVISKFEATLVKFDVSFPYGDKHEAFVALANDARDVDELLIAEVGVKDYGEKDNEALARKFGATKENFPVVKLFVKGKSEPVPFDDSKGFTTGELRRFIRENTGLYLSLAGCVKKLDLLANKFMASKKDDRKALLKETEDALKELTGKEATSGKIYKTIMEKIIEKGDDFVNAEQERVKKILSGKVSEEKKKELAIRVNILLTFQLHKKKGDKEDL